VRNIDPFYTPKCIAEALVSHATVERPQGWIADFAAGAGDLLKAARSRWPNSRVAAFDLNGRVAGQLKRWHPDWHVEAFDFFSDPATSHFLKEITGKVALCFLNPPFSHRGAGRTNVNFENAQVRCSFGMAFVIRALSFLTSNAELLCILPEGSLRSQRDEQAWNELRSYYKIAILGANSHTAFNGCTAHTVMARFSRRRVRARSTKERREKPIAFLRCRKVTLIRGGVSMCNSSMTNLAPRLPLIHTSELRNNTVDVFVRTVSHYLHSVHGPGVLIPRVGKPSSRKICKYLLRKPIVLSDCVLFIKCRRVGDANLISRNLMQRWNLVEHEYGGTCARYITLRALRRLLWKIGVRCY
jgi:hypothetical protein